MKYLTRRKIILSFVDILIFFISYILSLVLRFQFDLSEMDRYFSSILILPFVMIVVYHLFGVYNSIWRFAKLTDLMVVFNSSIIGFLSSFVLVELLRRYVTNFFLLPFSISAMTALIGTFLVVWSRIFWFAKNNGYFKKKNISSKSILIIGAGEAGTEILSEFERHPEFGIVRGFLDDDKNKIGRSIHGYRVYDDTSDIMKYVKELKINEIIISIPSASSKEIKQIFNKIDNKKVLVKTLPSFYEILNNKLSLGFLRNVEISDLLGRKEVNVDFNQIKEYISDKNILVTGAGGSIGSEICRQVCALNPKTLYILGRGENSIFKIKRELEERFPELKVEDIICDITNKDRMESIFKKFKFDVVFHAAAHKHVFLMEENPTEAFRVNSIGTYGLAKLADKYGIKKFIFISTDKAINPTSIMGTSKRFGEILIKSIARNSKTNFGIVRFGNVLGSRGSVVPIFKEQIKKGGPVTVTHPKMKRYFMTIPEAVALVIQSGEFAKNGEVFVLDMEEPVLIDHLARELIRLSGYIPDQDIEIVYTGTKPGEKLYEELFLNEEDYEKTQNKRIYIARNSTVLKDVEWLVANLLESIRSNDLDKLQNLIKEYIPDSTAIIRKNIAR